MGLILSTKSFRIKIIIILDFNTNILTKNYSEHIKNTDIASIIEHRYPARVTHVLKLLPFTREYKCIRKIHTI
jgi:hypothetical protein